MSDEPIPTQKSAKEIMCDSLFAVTKTGVLLNMRYEDYVTVMQAIQHPTPAGATNK